MVGKCKFYRLPSTIFLFVLDLHGATCFQAFVGGEGHQSGASAIGMGTADLAAVAGLDGIDEGAVLDVENRHLSGDRLRLLLTALIDFGIMRPAGVAHGVMGGPEVEEHAIA